jgi:hypothetical protein
VQSPHLHDRSPSGVTDIHWIEKKRGGDVVTAKGGPGPGECPFHGPSGKPASIACHSLRVSAVATERDAADRERFNPGVFDLGII